MKYLVVSAHSLENRVSVLNKKGQKAAVDFNFNGWGEDQVIHLIERRRACGEKCWGTRYKY